VSIDLLYDGPVEPVPVFQVFATFHSSGHDSGGAPEPAVSRVGAVPR
jgi:hypothetical protein